jgi:hypothetical protein
LSEVNLKPNKQEQKPKLEYTYRSPRPVPYRLGSDERPLVKIKLAALNDKFNQPPGPGHYDPKFDITKTRN